MEKKEETGLDDAYALRTPEDSRRLYRDWAETYDESFAGAHGYVYPERLAALFAAQPGAGGATPALDIGCGTGLVGVALRAALPSFELDGVDISAEMLAAARAKAVYRNLIEADLTGVLPFEDSAYGGFISAGTFTHGHVGPEALNELVRIARPGALFVLGVNAEVFEAGFGALLQAFENAGDIGALRIEEGRIYAESAKHEHRTDRFRAVIFTRR
ncbi:class I SAM-dependent methyltransferase [Pikeienuella piscinae]|uniref:Class I SAM-dependent methyltransferase n=1 Tax=Pikeienuella piscinae TaxID=2748098 RepID=A0A7L5BV11_9RHOB|nr:class I SAM-dependent methyltransferase [Pikeienuella piscinae]QIE55542.1 class I SAM-dependent methyltransferase [Pikeienuella piscinae]